MNAQRRLRLIGLALALVLGLVLGTVLAPLAGQEQAQVMACDPQCQGKSQGASGSAGTQAATAGQQTEDNEAAPLQIRTEEDLGRNPMRFYAFLDDRPKVTRGPLLELLRDKPGFRQIYRTFSAGGPAGFRPMPMLQWFVFANKRMKFFPTLGFILITSAVSWTVMPGRLGRAQAEERQRFWGSFGSGILTGLVMIVLVRMFLLTGVGWPLAVATVAALELGLVLGLATVVRLIGHSLLVVSRLSQRFTSRPRLALAIELLAGALVCAALLQVAGPHILPRIGTRLVCLFAVLGLGALWRTRQNVSNA